MMERILEPEFWAKWFMVILNTGLTFMVFSAVFDPEADIIPGGRLPLAIIGVIFGAFATYFYRME
jgi:hypothetical protein